MCFDVLLAYSQIKAQRLALITALYIKLASQITGSEPYTNHRPPHSNLSQCTHLNYIVHSAVYWYLHTYTHIPSSPPEM